MIFYLDLEQSRMESIIQEPCTAIFLTTTLVYNKHQLNNAVKIAEDICTIRKKMLLINEHLPKAWQKIISEPERWLAGIISEVTEDLCGYKPDAEIRVYERHRRYDENRRWSNR